MFIDKKYWLPGMLNADDADFRLQETEYINCQDFRIGTTSDEGLAEQLESVGGTVLIVNAGLPSTGTNICIGVARDYPNRRAVFFNWNSAGNHGIYLFDFVGDTIYTLLLNAEVTGGLNFDKYHLVHSARVENGNVYWTDNYNPPRRFNIQAAFNLHQENLAPAFSSIDQDVVYTQSGGFLVCTYTLFNVNPPLLYGSNLYLNLNRFGTGGSHAGNTLLRIPLDWTTYPTVPYYQILASGIAAYLLTIDPTSANWSVTTGSITSSSANIIVSIKDTWDWGLGDPSFPPTTQLPMFLYNLVTPAYLPPISQSVISWIRRQPGLPPSQTKVMPAVQNGSPNFIAKEAFQFCYRYQYTNYEYSTLSGLSTLADFNEQDPPPTETSLNIVNSSLVTNGYLATNILLPSSPTPGYGSNVLAKLTRIGTGGSSAASIDIPIPLNWSGYPATKSYTRVIVEGLNNYFITLPGNGSTGQLTTGDLPQSVPQSGKWYISYRDGTHPTLNILETWDWGLGDPSFPPTVEANLTLFVQTPAPSKQFDHISVVIPFLESIDQDVIRVDLVAKYLVGGVYFIIKSWQTTIAADLLAIERHNAGLAQLSYDFYNNTTGIALDATYSVKPYDSVPLLAASIEMATNRGFMANVLAGYSSSNSVTSLAITQVTAQIGQPIGTYITGEWFAVRYVDPFGGIHQFYMAQTTSALAPEPFSPYYYYTYASAGPPFPPAVTSGIVFLGTTIPAACTAYAQTFAQPAFVYLISITDQGESSALLSTNQTLNFGVLAKAFKANATYQVAMGFLDFAGRKGGVITSDALKFTTGNTGFSTNTYTTGVQWTLTSNITEIPTWAAYYAILVTKCLRTRFFLEAIGFAVYAGKDSSNNYTFTTHSYSTDLAGVAIDISFLQSNGMGYTFTQGDAINMYLNGAYYSLAIIGQSAQYVIAELFNIGQLGSTSLVQYEIYTPYKQTATEPYYEVQIYPIVNPGTSSRAYSVNTGTIAGDVFIFQRSNDGISYVTEAMSPNNLYYTSWFTDAGRSNFIDTIGQQTKLTSIAYSNTFIAGTQNNGLSTFDALDTADLSPDFGAINKLQLASKVQKIGTVMLAICGGSQTASLYLSENTLISNTGDSVVGQASAVIGSVHQLKGDFGTVNPESVVEWRGNVYWFDAQNGKIIQYADNGLFPISNYKISRYWNLFAEQYKTLTASQIEALGSRPFVFGTADPHHGELLFTVPTVLATPPQGYLPDYPSTVYPFDIWDGQGKTLIFKLYADPNKWQGSYSFTPEYSFYLENNLYSFKGGNLYLHNQPNYCQYYGTQYSPSIMCVSNQQLNKPKSYNNFSVEANASPVFVYVMSRYPYVQSSDLLSIDFTTLEGLFYAPLYRNKLDPAFGGNYPLALTAGEKMRTTALYIWAQWSVNGIVQVKFCNVGYTLSLGQKV